MVNLGPSLGRLILDPRTTLLITADKVDIVAKKNPEDVVRNYFAAWSHHDLDAMAAMLDPDFVSVDPLNPAKSREEYLKSQPPNFKAFPTSKSRS